MGVAKVVAKGKAKVVVSGKRKVKTETPVLRFVESHNYKVLMLPEAQRRVVPVWLRGRDKG